MEKDRLSPDTTNYWAQLGTLSVIFMKLSWIILWFQVFIQIPHGSILFSIGLTMGLMLLIMVVITRGLDSFRIKAGIQRVFLVGFLLVWVLTFLNGWNRLALILQTTGPVKILSSELSLIAHLFPPEFVLAVFAILIWQQGIAIGKMRIGPSATTKAFWSGLMLFLLYPFLTFLPAKQNYGFEFYLFLVSSLLAIGFARIAILTELDKARSQPFDIRWAGGFILISGFSVAAAYVIGVFINNPIGVLFNRIRFLSGEAIQWIARILITPLYWFLMMISPWLERMRFSMQSLPLPTPAATPGIPEGMAELTNEAAKATGISSDFLGPILVGFILVIILLMVILGVRQNRVRAMLKQVEEKDDLESDSNVLDSVLNNVQKKVKDMVSGLIDAIGLNRNRLRAEFRIRWIYRNLELLFRDLGVPRKHYVTPLEYQFEIQQIIPECSDEIMQITQSYIQVRYGEIPESSVQVAKVEAAWMKVSDVGLVMKQRKKGDLVQS